VTTGTFLVLDAVTLILHGSSLLTTPWIVNMVLLVSRGCVVSFGSALWYIGHSAMFLVYGLTVGTICVLYRLRADEKKLERQSMSTAVESKAPATTETSCLKHPYAAMGVLLVAVIVELIMVVFVVPSSFDMTTVILMDGSPHNQYEFGFGALFLVLGWSLFYLWYRLMRREAKMKGVSDMYVFNGETKILLGLLFIFFIGGGVGLFIITKSYLILFSAIFVPPMIIASLLLYGRWVGNDFRWCQRRSLRLNTRGDSERRKLMGDDYVDAAEAKEKEEKEEKEAADAAAGGAAGGGANAAAADADAESSNPNGGESGGKKDEETSDENVASPDDAGANATPGSRKTGGDDTKTMAEEEADHLDGISSTPYKQPGLCGKANAKYADALCKDGCGACFGHCRKPTGDFRKTHWCVALWRCGMTTKGKDYFFFFRQRREERKRREGRRRRRLHPLASPNERRSLTLRARSLILKVKDSKE